MPVDHPGAGRLVVDAGALLAEGHEVVDDAETGDGPHHLTHHGAGPWAVVEAALQAEGQAGAAAKLFRPSQELGVEEQNPAGIVLDGKDAQVDLALTAVGDEIR